MNRLDYELGFSHSDGDWSGADGMAAAKAVLVGCIVKCTAAHPLNKDKRDDCKGKCQAAYEAKTNYIIENIQAPQPVLNSGIKGTLYVAPTSGQNPTPPSYDNSGTTNTGSNNDNSLSQDKASLSTGVKIGIGVGVLALIIVGGIIIFKRKKG